MKIWGFVKATQTYLCKGKNMDGYVSIKLYLQNRQQLTLGDSQYYLFLKKTMQNISWK